METLEHLWKTELVDCIHFLHSKGYAPATSSNYSFRIPAAKDIVISASGIDKGEFSEDDLMKVDLKGVPINDDRKPSAETLLHTMIYNRLPEIACVLHTHTVYNTVLSTIYRFDKELKLGGFEVLKGLEGINTHEVSIKIPIFENSQEMPKLAEKISAHWEEHPDMKGFLLAGHGLYSWGSSIASAKRHIELLEFLFECVYLIGNFRK